MITHLEDKPKSGIIRKAYTLELTYRYATICDVFFYVGQDEHRIADPGAVPTCPTCNAVTEREAKAAEARCGLIEQIVLGPARPLKNAQELREFRRFMKQDDVRNAESACSYDCTFPLHVMVAEGHLEKAARFGCVWMFKSERDAMLDAVKP
jgi:hypothetical protein